jgi:hypothetical protein
MVSLEVSVLVEVFIIFHVKELGRLLRLPLDLRSLAITDHVQGTEKAYLFQPTQLLDVSFLV